MTNNHPYTQSDYNAAQVEIARLNRQLELRVDISSKQDALIAELQSQLTEARQQISDMIPTIQPPL